MKTKCAYCNRRMGKYNCAQMLSAHCSDCCVVGCGVPNFMAESMATAKEMAGCCWPSAAATKLAMVTLLNKVSDHLRAKKVPKKTIEDLRYIAGMAGSRPKGSK